jgi:hypothetical protein
MLATCRRLRAINTIAKRLKPQFPDVAVDTLAYQQTVVPPKLTKPVSSVIIRLCDSGDIASKNLGVPLTDPSNRAFAAAIEGWFALTPRIYVWNYVVDFGNTLQPLPNTYSLGPNIQWWAAHGVRGVFQEGPGLIQGDVSVTFATTLQFWLDAGHTLIKPRLLPSHAPTATLTLRWICCRAPTWKS